MTFAPRRQAFSEYSQPPLGEVTLVPAQAGGRSEIALACALMDAQSGAEPRLRDEILNSLRLHFPLSPLTVRITALGALARRAFHIPR